MTTTETAASKKRPWTEDRRNDDGSTTVTMKRACNGCGELVGDVSDEEIEAAVDGRPLPDVRGECPRCTRCNLCQHDGANHDAGECWARMEGGQCSCWWYTPAYQEAAR